jgi:rubrerythrin
MMSKTQDNLKIAFAGESQANRRYLAYARKAEEEGYPQIAKLFRAAAEAETIHAHSHLRNLGEVKATAENLETAIAGENYESVTMYPDFIAVAQQEDENKALTSFRWALEAEKVHEQLYRQALAGLGIETETYDYYVCPICGYTHGRNAPDKCPVCGTPGTRFLRVS